MNDISLYIHTNEQKTGDWTLAGKLDFTSMDSSWMLEGKLPQEKDIVPWQTFVLPNGERIDLGLVFDDPAQCLSLYVRTESGPILDLITKGHPCLRFVSPAGVNISLQVHESC